eukprot:m.81776 g.81776  ORF g.81776 m.81776 type:complete len:512 (-) comp14704_c1_seq1:57-1592(-)
MYMLRSLVSSTGFSGSPRVLTGRSFSGGALMTRLKLIKRPSDERDKLELAADLCLEPRLAGGGGLLGLDLLEAALRAGGGRGGLLAWSEGDLARCSAAAGVGAACSKAALSAASPASSISSTCWCRGCCCCSSSSSSSSSPSIDKAGLRAEGSGGPRLRPRPRPRLAPRPRPPPMPLSGLAMASGFVAGTGNGRPSLGGLGDDIVEESDDENEDEDNDNDKDEVEDNDKEDTLCDSASPGAACSSSSSSSSKTPERGFPGLCVRNLVGAATPLRGRPEIAGAADTLAASSAPSPSSSSSSSSNTPESGLALTSGLRAVGGAAPLRGRGRVCGAAPPAEPVVSRSAPCAPSASPCTSAAASSSSSSSKTPDSGLRAGTEAGGLRDVGGATPLRGREGLEAGKGLAPRGFGFGAGPPEVPGAEGGRLGGVRFCGGADAAAAVADRASLAAGLGFGRGAATGRTGAGGLSPALPSAGSAGGGPGMVTRVWTTNNEQLACYRAMSRKSAIASSQC